MKKRAYFFLNYEGTRRAEEQSAVREVPTESLKDGVIFYQCDHNSLTVATDCPGGTVTGISGKTYTVPAPVGTTAYYALNATQITAMDPQGLGPNPVVLSYFNQYPNPNDTTQGDGLNFSGYRFRAPIKDTVNWYIAKLDYNITQDAKHRLSVSGGLTNQSNPQAPLLLGTAPENTFLNFNKGIITNYSGVISNTLVNNFRYGFVRQSYGNIGDSDQPWNFIRSLSQGVTRSSVSISPAHTFSDDLSWTHRTHTLQFGMSLGYTSNPRKNTTNSFSDSIANASWLDVAGMLVKPSPFNPANNGYPAGDDSFANAYDFPLMGMLGMATEVDAYYNYLKDGSVLPQGTPVSRHFAFRTYEFYAQDSWKVKPNLTFTYGLRYSLFPAPWETNGLQVATTDASGNPLPLAKWFGQRAVNMANGIPSNQDPLVSFSLAGPANGKPGLYHTDYHNFAPRLAIAWSPKASSGLFKSLFGEGGKTTIRAGFGVAYDSIRSGLLDTFDSAGSFGMASTLTNPAGVVSADCAPRITSMNVIPTTDACDNQLMVPAPPGKFPQTFPNTLDNGGFCICWGLDDSIKTPYSYTLDFSVGRELPGGFSLEVSYVGRLAHRLLAQEDLAMPLNYVDPKSKVDYFSAVTALAKLYRQGIPTSSITPAMVGPTASYWGNLLKPGGGYYELCSDAVTDDPLQAAYDLFSCFSTNETTALFILDYFDIPGAMNTGSNTFFNPQFSSLYAWRSNSNANYHALQVNVRHAMRHGFQFDFNYTFSKSIDLFSDATRVGAWGGIGGQMINSWQPNALRAVSDYDVRHQFNANWVAELPFGRGKMLAGNASKALDAVIGGWQLSGLFRLTSGFPVNIFNGYNWPTNWQLGGEAILVAPVKSGTYYINGATDPNRGNVNIFANGVDAISAFRAPFPGEGGARNQVRGAGYFGVDMGLAKRWKMPYSERHSLQLRWEVFNVTNSKRFDVQSISGELDISSTFGNYSRLLTNPRVMQFALRYEF